MERLMTRKTEPAEECARLAEKAIPKIARAAQKDAAAGEICAQPKVLADLKKDEEQVLLNEARREGGKLDAALAGQEADQPAPADVACRAAINARDAEANHLLATFSVAHRLACASTITADRALRAFAAHVGMDNLIPAARPLGVVVTAVLVTLLMAESLAGAALLANVAPSRAHAWAIGVIAAAIVLAQGLGGGIIGKEMRRPEVWRKAIGVTAWAANFVLGGLVAIAMVAVREQSLAHADLDMGIEAALPALIATLHSGDAAWLFSSLPAVLLLATTLAASQLAFLKGMALGYEMPGEKEPRGELAAAERHQTEVENVARADLAEAGEIAAEAIDDTQHAHGDHAEADVILLRQAEADLRTLDTGIASANACLEDAADDYRQRAKRVLGPLTALPEIVTPRVDLSAERSAAEARVTRAAMAAEASRTAAIRAERICHQAKLDLQDDIRADADQLQAIIDGNLPDTVRNRAPDRPIALLTQARHA